MLDEPSLGSPQFSQSDLWYIKDQSTGNTILLVEQNVFHSLTSPIEEYVLENGSIVLSGTGQELLKISTSAKVTWFMKLEFRLPLKKG